MATKNPFDILGDDDNDDPSSLIAIHQQKIAAKKPAGADSAAPSKAPAKLPTKPLPPAQAVREAKADVASRSGGGGGRGGRGRGGRIGGATQNKDLGNGNIEGFGGSYGGGGGGQDGETGKGGSYGQPRQSYGGYRHGGNGEGDGDERPPRRVFERRSGTGRGNDFKREGSGRGNWGTVADDVIAQESVEAASVENATPEKKPGQENAPGYDSYEVKKEKEEGATNDGEQKEEEVKEMTLEEYEKVREEKRKALISMKAKERKVDVDKEFQSMQQLSLKKENDDVFIKLGSDKDSRKQKDNADRDEKTKKSVSINEFLKPAAGGRYNGPGGRGRGRGRGGHDGFERGDSATPYVEAMIKIEDPGQFPILGGK